MNVHTDPLVEDYLRHLEAVASALPAYRREELLAEIREHLAEALRQVPAGDEAAVRSVLERLGSPEEIVAAAADPMPPGQPFVPVPETNGLAVASLLFGIFWLGGIGSVAALVLGLPGAPGDQELGWRPAGVQPGHHRDRPGLDRDRPAGDRGRRRVRPAGRHRDHGHGPPRPADRPRGRVPR